MLKRLSWADGGLNNDYPDQGMRWCIRRVSGDNTIAAMDISAICY